MAEKTYNEIHHPEIVAEYDKAGLQAPYGKGIHTLAFHKAAIKYMKQGHSKDDAYRKAMSELGRNKAVNPEHRSGTLRKHFMLKKRRKYDAA